MKLALGWDLTRRLTVSSNINVAYASSDDDRFTQLSGSLTLGIGVLERLSSFLEVYGFNREEPGGTARHFLNGGLVIQVAPDFQLDARVGVGLDRIRPDYFMGFGSVLRL